MKRELTTEELIKVSYLQDEANSVAEKILNQDMSRAEAARFLADIAERLEEIVK